MGAQHQLNDKYYQLLGRFIHTFADVEAWMQLLLWEHAETNNSIAQAIFSGVRTQVASDMVRRIHEATAQNIDQDLTDAFAQLGAINRARNLIIHYGARFDDEGKPKFSNELLAHTPSKLREIPISEELFESLIADLELIIRRLRFFTVDRLLSDQPDKRRPKSDFPDIWSTPWQYKP